MGRTGTSSRSTPGKSSRGRPSAAAPPVLRSEEEGISDADQTAGPRRDRLPRPRAGLLGDRRADPAVSDPDPGARASSRGEEGARAGEKGRGAKSPGRGATRLRLLPRGPGEEGARESARADSG